MKKIPIFFTFNNDYSVPAAVAFYSLLNKAKQDVYYEMYVLHSDITTMNQKLLQDIVLKFKNAKLSFIDTEGYFDDFWINGNFAGHNTRGQFTADTIARCFGVKFFPQYDKIIYSDVDVIFMDDISELFDINLDDKYIAGVKNPFMKWSQNELSHLSKENFNMLKDSYIAGGIWVLNLKKIRDDKLEDRMIEIIKDDTIIKRWNDQDVVNIACKNKVAYIPLNYISYPYLADLLRMPDFISHYSRDEMYDSIINPKILHFAAEKPWNGTSKKAEIWFEIFDYLNLPKTRIFTPAPKSAHEIKLKKYKKLFNLFSILLIVLSALLIVLLSIYLIK